MLKEHKLEIRVLNYFIAVADDENFSKAAQSIHITQPTLSRQIQDLEDELGTVLFERSHHSRKLVLTADGIRFYNYAREIVQLAEKAKDDFKKYPEEISGEIFIGAGESDSVRILAEAAKIIREKFPKIKISICSGNSSLVSEWLDRGLCDLGLFIGGENTLRYDFVRVKKKDRWGLLVRKGSPLAAKKNIRPADLKNEPVMISSQNTAKTEIENWMDGSNFKLNVSGTYNLLYNAAIFVEEGVCSAICLDNLADTKRSESPLAWIPLKGAEEIVSYIAWKKNSVLSDAAKIFLDEICAEKNQLIL